MDEKKRREYERQRLATLEEVTILFKRARTDDRVRSNKILRYEEKLSYSITPSQIVKEQERQKKFIENKQNLEFKNSKKNINIILISFIILVGAIFYISLSANILLLLMFLIIIYLIQFNIEL